MDIAAIFCLINLAMYTIVIVNPNRNRIDYPIPIGVDREKMALIRLIWPS